MTARYTVAFLNFKNSQKEVELLARNAVSIERKSPLTARHEINALCRASLVLLSAHLEAYIKEIGELALESLYEKKIPRANLAPLFFYHISKRHFDELKGTTEPEKIGIKVFEFLREDGELWSLEENFPKPIAAEKFNKGFSNPTYPKIQAYFSRFGYKNFSSDMAKRLKADFEPSRNMVDHLVDTRNKIAHGDQQITKTPTDILQMLKIIKDFCRSTDFLFSSWWRQSYCAIR